MLDIRAILLKSTDIKLELSKNFYEEITQEFQEKKSILEKKYYEEEVIEESFENILNGLVDDYQEQEEFENLASMLIISRNYFILEHHLKLLVGNLLKKEGKLINENYKKWGIDDVSNFFKKREIDISEIDGYKECNVLRLLVNDIKHNGAMVSKRLAKAKGEVLEERELKEIKVSHDEINKYSDVIKLFYANLIGCLDKYFI